MEKTGLSLIGIGPGNLDLMTKQAVEVSQSADTVSYTHLTLPPLYSV